MTEAHPNRRWFTLALLATVQFVLVLDAAIVGIALPSMGRDLGMAQEQLSWVVNAYTLLFGGFLLLGGRLSDLVGPRRLFMLGFVLFTAASALGGVAQSPLWLVAARAVQGLAAALVSPAALALVLTTFTVKKERDFALSLWGTVAVSGAAAGLMIGGVLTELLNWRSVLFVNVPIGIATIALAPMLIPADPKRKGPRGGFDLAGAVTVTGGLGLLIYALVNTTEAGWTSLQTIGMLVASAVLLIAFILIELRVATPLVPLGIFRSRSLSSSNIVLLALVMALFPTFFFLGLYTQNVLGYTPLQSGIAQLPLVGLLALGTHNAPRILQSFGVKRYLVFSLISVTLGMLWFSRLTVSGDYLTMILGPSLLVAPIGVSWVALFIAATQDSAPDQAGLVSGLINTSGQVGGALGIGLLVTIAGTFTRDVLAAGETALGVAQVEGYRIGFLVGAGLAIVAAIAAITLMPGDKPMTSPAEAPVTPEFGDAAGA